MGSGGEVSKGYKQLADNVVCPAAGLIETAFDGYIPDLGQESGKLLLCQVQLSKAQNEFLAPAVGFDCPKPGQTVDELPIPVRGHAQPRQGLVVDADIAAVQMQMRRQQRDMLRADLVTAQDHAADGGGVELTGAVREHDSDPAMEMLLILVMGAEQEMAEADGVELAGIGIGQKDMDQGKRFGNDGLPDICTGGYFGLLIGVEGQRGLANVPVGLQDQAAGDHIAVGGNGGEHIDMVGLEISQELRRLGIGDECPALDRKPKTGCFRLRLSIRCGKQPGCGDGIEIGGDQLVQRDMQDVSDLHEQTELAVGLTGQIFAQIPLIDRIAPCLQLGNELTLADAGSTDQRAEILADQTRIMVVQLSGLFGR